MAFGVSTESTAIIRVPLVILAVLYTAYARIIAADKAGAAVKGSSATNPQEAAGLARVVGIAYLSAAAIGAPGAGVPIKPAGKASVGATVANQAGATLRAI